MRNVVILILPDGTREQPLTFMQTMGRVREVCKQGYRADIRNITPVVKEIYFIPKEAV